MRRKRALTMAWQNMMHRKFRTSLTTLGVVIGITAIIALASFGEGFRVMVKERVERGFELDVLRVFPGGLIGSGRTEFVGEDVQKIREIDEIDIATPLMWRGATLHSGDNTLKTWVLATNLTEFWKIYPERLAFSEGGLPKPIKNDTIVLGYKVAHPSENAAFSRVDENVTVEVTLWEGGRSVSKNYTFGVAGILRKGAEAGWLNFDNCAFIPLDAAREVYKTGYLDLIFVKLDKPEFSEDVATKIEDMFDDQVGVLAPSILMQQVEDVMSMIEIFLTCVGSIALLVAGIGIMNIITVSVMERTHEIGILKAIGAKNRTIQTMFLVEALIIGIVGVLLSVPIGYGLAHILGHVMSSILPQLRQYYQMPPQETARTTITPILSPLLAVGAIGFGIAICLLFGWYPARKAANLDPVEALRHE